MGTDHFYARGLVEKMGEKQHLSEAVKQAFLEIPRHIFVPSYYERTQGGYVLHTQEENDTWYQHIYDDVSLVTLVNDQGQAISSSSQPSIMAPMLEYLDVRPGLRVLEIGTGTGYNAGILAHLAGDSALVTTLDIDPQLTKQAQERIEQVIGPMAVVTGDGEQGYGNNAPYDRIIATASTATVPQAWYEQLAPGGILVCILQHNGVGGVVKAIKDPHTSQLRGHILHGASFMPLHNAYPHDAPSFQPLPLKDRFSLPEGWFDTALFEDPHFRFYWYGVYPRAHITFLQSRKHAKLIATTDREQQGYVAFHRFCIELYGDDSPIHWNRMVASYRYWIHAGRPVITDYGFEMDKQRQYIFVERQGAKMYPFVH
jgi:protein-L-isoaspartate(D-aspartate) O-methyltransferase